MQRDASDSALRRFRRMVLSVADDRVANCRELHSDLILQSRYQGDLNERSVAKGAFDEITEFRTSGGGVALGGQLLKHSFSSKVMHQRLFFGGERPANDREILPHRRVAKKLPDQRVSIRLGFCKEKDPGSEAVDAMYDKCPLSPRLQLRGKKGPGGLGVGASHRHGIKAGGFIQGHDGIVLIKHEKLS